MIKRLINWARSLAAWREVGRRGVWRYDQNLITGQRRATRIVELYGPIDRVFIRPGDKIIDCMGFER